MIHPWSYRHTGTSRHTLHVQFIGFLTNIRFEEHSKKKSARFKKRLSRLSRPSGIVLVVLVLFKKIEIRGYYLLSHELDMSNF